MREHSPICADHGDCDDHDARWRKHVAACSPCDFTFWVRQDDEGRWIATEVETGISGPAADSAREALDLYWGPR